MTHEQQVKNLKQSISEYAEKIRSANSSLQALISHLKGITEENIQPEQPETATGQEMAKDGEYTQLPCLECKDVYKMCHLQCDKITSPWNPTIKTNPNIIGDNFQIQNNRGEVLYDSKLDYKKMKRMQVSDGGNVLLSAPHGQIEHIPCNTCGNIRKPTTKIKDGYYCQGCSQDITPDNIAETSLLKRKYCECGKRLPGFYDSLDMDNILCNDCLERLR